MSQEVEDTSTWKDHIITNEKNTENEEPPEEIKNQSDLRYSIKCQIVQAVDRGIQNEERIKNLINKSDPLITDCIRDLENEGVLDKQ